MASQLARKFSLQRTERGLRFTLAALRRHLHRVTAALAGAASAAGDELNGIGPPECAVAVRVCGAGACEAGSRPGTIDSGPPAEATRGSRTALVAGGWGLPDAVPVGAPMAARDPACCGLMMTVWTGLLSAAGPLSWLGGAIGWCAAPLGAPGIAGMVAGGDPVSGGPSCIGATGALDMTGIVVITRGGGLAACRFDRLFLVRDELLASAFRHALVWLAGRGLRVLLRQDFDRRIAGRDDRRQRRDERAAEHGAVTQRAGGAEHAKPKMASPIMVPRRRGAEPA